MTRSIQKILKRIFDFLAAVFWLILLSPLFLLIAILVKITSKGPVFYRDTRVGTGGKEFIAYKFRSMVENAANMGLGIEVAENDSRITGVGEFLRHWSLDELPQLINVLTGEMSLVGPRPALPHQVAKYSDFEKRRLKVRPGITGWAQINGRNLISWKKRIELDIWYIDHWSLWFDLKILLLTPISALKKEGLYGEGGMVRDYE
ncbi:MAG: exopolysaccharide biosynthesis polyprenyl glycosylphosphotransferase [Candidatus Omnitrophica bacterium]|nr:exopolysaccharide biosynthesis polyprenyl glycosylphosphotransferase [Candidatus Omnitrophota bacterium]